MLPGPYILASDSIQLQVLSLVNGFLSFILFIVVPFACVLHLAVKCARRIKTSWEELRHSLLWWWISTLLGVKRLLNIQMRLSVKTSSVRIIEKVLEKINIFEKVLIKAPSFIVLSLPIPKSFADFCSYWRIYEPSLSKLLRYNSLVKQTCDCSCDCEPVIEHEQKIANVLSFYRRFSEKGIILL